MNKATFCSGIMKDETERSEEMSNKVVKELNAVLNGEQMAVEEYSRFIVLGRRGFDGGQAD